MSKRPQKIDPEQFEREQRDLFVHGDMKQAAYHSGIRYNTLTKGLEPDNPAASIATEFLNFLYGCHMTRPELEERVWALVSLYRRRMLAQETACDSPSEVIAACSDFASVLARREDGHRTPEEVETARQNVIEKVTSYSPAFDLGNAG